MGPCVLLHDMSVFFTTIVSGFALIHVDSTELKKHNLSSVHEHDTSYIQYLRNTIPEYSVSSIINTKHTKQ